MFYSNCGKEIIEGQVFCPTCGHKIKIRKDETENVPDNDIDKNSESEVKNNTINSFLEVLSLFLTFVCVLSCFFPLLMEVDIWERTYYNFFSIIKGLNDINPSGNEAIVFLGLISIACLVVAIISGIGVIYTLLKKKLSNIMLVSMIAFEAYIFCTMQFGRLADDDLTYTTFGWAMLMIPIANSVIYLYEKYEKSHKTHSILSVI